MSKNRLFSKSVLLFCLSGLLLFVASCNFEDVGGGKSNPPDKPDPKPNPPADTAGTVPPDGILETVTWNLEWYGSGFSGPPDFELQTKNIVQVADSLKADLYAFEEVNRQKSLDSIIVKLPGYKGFVADYINQSQQMAFVYNTNTIDSLEAGPILNVSDFSNENWNYYWASGRLPLYFKFNYTYKNSTTKFYAIAIHAISNYGDDTDEDYARRTNAVKGLYDYLKNNKPDANIILLGDYNDDVDVSIFDNKSESPYLSFVADTSNFRVITKTLSDSQQSSTVKYTDTIDHITMSDELFPFYIDGSVAVFKKAETFIPNYEQSTSDHYPVWTKFDMR